MPTYCSPDDVREIARQFSIDVVEDQLLDDRIMPIIEEATYEIKHKLLPRFDLSIINAAIPFAVLKLTALISAKKLFIRYQNQSTDANEKEVKRLEEQIYFWDCQITNGTILDAADVPISAIFEPETIKQNPSEVAKLYACASRSYNSYTLSELDQCRPSE